MPLCTRIHQGGQIQIVFGLLVGMLFGFFLQKAGVTSYDVIIGQLLLENFTVVKVMLSAVIVAMIGVHLLVRFGYAQLHVWTGSWGSNLVGGLIFGVGFALLGLCPGTAAGAAGTGALDALIGGVFGLLVGSGLFAHLYPRIKPILCQGMFPVQTLPELLHLNRWIVIILVEACMICILLALACIGL